MLFRSPPFLQYYSLNKLNQYSSPELAAAAARAASLIQLRKWFDICIVTDAIVAATHTPNAQAVKPIMRAAARLFAHSLIIIS